MSKEAYAVIGANWGDEGKGLTVDAIASRLVDGGREVTVVRSNGGAQAGHGVERPEGGRHVFHHIGSGSFVAAATHLSQFFIAHPMVMQKEIGDLENLDVRPYRITIDPRAAVTTPWDMAINQALEIKRAGERHGSCGLGIGETIERQEKGWRLCAADLWHKDLREKLENIRDEWVPRRLEILGINPEKSPLAEILTGRAELISAFLADCRGFTQTVEILPDAELISRDVVLFEGAQGLQLDMDFGVFPHVTRAHTGIRNMLAIAKEADIQTIKATYVTRAYATRHGAGPLPNEAVGAAGPGKIDWADINDPTNVSNDWQGGIREAPLDLDLLKETLKKDVSLADGTDIQVRAGIGVTCLDQIPKAATFFRNGQEYQVVTKSIAAELETRTGLPIVLTASGPTRKTTNVLWPDLALRRQV
ncbi:adenylosuccinate synthetase [Pelagibius sp. Alg239-R121]|uniref:adenylosuccinate synthetase n=1 Tax=Pelagibius sp. Alg239-R121 TaxID=2993448 RepID=UPI0024A6DCB9|nr:adenylosuccinate synthetase [Pelagibius sp. Alg239-R121]